MKQPIVGLIAKSLACTGLTALSFFAVAGVADAFDFTFSINNTKGNVAGTVQGRIFGLAYNGPSIASRVLIDTFPSELNSIAGSTPINVMLWDQQYENSFTTINGQVVSGNFWAQQSINGFAPGFQLYINGQSCNNCNFVNLDGTDNFYVWGDNGLAAANISAVPEPLTILGSIAATGFVAAFNRIKSKKED
jgi:hypothetical protein